MPASRSSSADLAAAHQPQSRRPARSPRPQTPAEEAGSGGESPDRQEDDSGFPKIGQPGGLASEPDFAFNEALALCLSGRLTRLRQRRLLDEDLLASAATIWRRLSRGALRDSGGQLDAALIAHCERDLRLTLQQPPQTASTRSELGDEIEPSGADFSPSDELA